MTVNVIKKDAQMISIVYDFNDLEALTVSLSVVELGFEGFEEDSVSVAVAGSVVLAGSGGNV